MSQHVGAQNEGGVLTIRFNRAEKKNALTSAMYAAIAAALTAAADDPAVRVVIITGSEDSFTAGNDLMDFMANQDITGGPVIEFLRVFAAFPKPIIAAVNGLAIGVGTTLLLHCDLAYAAQGARFQLPFVNLAAVPEFASSLLLPRLIGHVRAAELLMFGEPFSADKALALGLLNAVLAPADVMTHAMAKAKVLAAKPPAALRQTKALMRGHIGDITARIDLENKMFSECLKSAEFTEAATAFFEKRAPDFSKF